MLTWLSSTYCREIGHSPSFISFLFQDEIGSLKTLPSNSLNLSFPCFTISRFPIPATRSLMKLLRINQIPAGNPQGLNFFNAVKALGLSALIVLYINISLSLYSNLSNSHRAAFSHPPFLNLASRSFAPLLASPNSNRSRGLGRGCQVSKGEWVPDPKAPYYTNESCWTIQEHQNCIKYGRPDLEFLKWRWRPDGCDLPLFEPAEFLQLMRGKGLAFVGDSLARNQMQSLLCLLSRVVYPEEIPSSKDTITQMFYKDYNFTIWAFWSPFLIRGVESKIKGRDYGMWRLYLDEPDPLWPPYLSKLSHIVLNTGNWYTRPAHFYEKHKLVGCHYCVIKNVTFMSIYKAHRRAFRTALDAIVAENKRGFKGVAVVRTISPSHFEGGEWNKGGDCKRTKPFERGQVKLKGMDLELYMDQLKEFWKAKWEGHEKGLDFRLLDTTQAMLLRPDGHPSQYGHWPHEERVLYNDCVHWCLPGPVDMWNDLLLQVLSI